MEMPERKRIEKIGEILSDPSLDPPKWAGNNMTTKLLYALGIDNKPELVSNEKYEKASGTEVFRGVMGGIGLTSEQIANQIKTADLPWISEYYGGLHFSEDREYAEGYTRGIGTVVKAKIKPSAKIVERDTISDEAFRMAHKIYRKSGVNLGVSAEAAYCVLHGIKGYANKRFNEIIILDRSALVMPKGRKR